MTICNQARRLSSVSLQQLSPAGKSAALTSTNRLQQELEALALEQQTDLSSFPPSGDSSKKYRLERIAEQDTVVDTVGCGHSCSTSTIDRSTTPTPSSSVDQLEEPESEFNSSSSYIHSRSEEESSGEIVTYIVDQKRSNNSSRSVTFLEEHFVNKYSGRGSCHYSTNNRSPKSAFRGGTSLLLNRRRVINNKTSTCSSTCSSLAIEETSAADQSCLSPSNLSNLVISIGHLLRKNLARDLLRKRRTSSGGSTSVVLSPKNSHYTTEITSPKYTGSVYYH